MIEVNDDNGNKVESGKLLSESDRNYNSYSTIANAHLQQLDEDQDQPLPRTELDSHANMVVLGKHSFIFDRVREQTCEVLPFDPNIGRAKDVPIVDGAIAYECQYSDER